MEGLSELLKSISDAPSSQIDPDVANRIRSLIGESNSKIRSELKDILDHCVKHSLASSFAMQSIDWAWKMASIACQFGFEDHE